MREQLTKLLNTTIIASKLQKNKEVAETAGAFAAKMQPLLQSSAMDAILRAIEEHALESGISFEDAALNVVKTFRDLDSLWNDYIMHEGLTTLHGKLKRSTSSE